VLEVDMALSFLSELQADSKNIQLLTQSWLLPIRQPPSYIPTIYQQPALISIPQ